MQKLWRSFEAYEFESVDLNAQSAATRGGLLSYSIEFVALGFLHAGDYQLHRDDDVQTPRFFRSADGAVLGWIADQDGRRDYRFASILSDGTLVQSAPEKPHAPWSCCRFPVHINFGAKCGLEDLLVMHLNSIAELEHGCGPVLKYDTSQLREVVLYMQMLIHETVHAQGAPSASLPIPSASPVRELVAI